MLVETVRVDHLVARLCELEQHHKKLGLVTHAQGVRTAIALVQQDLNASRLMAEGQPPVDGAAIVAMAAALISRPSAGP